MKEVLYWLYPDYNKALITPCGQFKDLDLV